MVDDVSKHCDVHKKQSPWPVTNKLPTKHQGIGREKLYFTKSKVLLLFGFAWNIWKFVTSVFS